MTGPLRPCGRAECRLCNPRPLHEEPRDGIVELGWGLLLFVLIGIVCFVLLPVLGA